MPMHAARDIGKYVRPSVRLSVRHTLVLYRNECTYRQLIPPSGRGMTIFFERYRRYKNSRGTQQGR